MIKKMQKTENLLGDKVLYDDFCRVSDNEF